MAIQNQTITVLYIQCRTFTMCSARNLNLQSLSFYTFNTFRSWEIKCTKVTPVLTNPRTPSVKSSSQSSQWTIPLMDLVGGGCSI